MRLRGKEWQVRNQGSLAGLQVGEDAEPPSIEDYAVSFTPKPAMTQPDTALKPMKSLKSRAIFPDIPDLALTVPRGIAQSYHLAFND
jgi:hypothetical protein